jgi:DNA-directed RNA polymerase beta subunit
VPLVTEAPLQPDSKSVSREILAVIVSPKNTAKSLHVAGTQIIITKTAGARQQEKDYTIPPREFMSTKSVSSCAQRRNPHQPENPGEEGDTVKRAGDRRRSLHSGGEWISNVLVAFMPWNGYNFEDHPHQ